jgi:hypothetical protein
MSISRDEKSSATQQMKTRWFYDSQLNNAVGTRATRQSTTAAMSTPTDSLPSPHVLIETLHVLFDVHLCVKRTVLGRNASQYDKVCFVNETKILHQGKLFFSCDVMVGKITFYPSKIERHTQSLCFPGRCDHTVSKDLGRYVYHSLEQSRQASLCLVLLEADTNGGWAQKLIGEHSHVILYDRNSRQRSPLGCLYSSRGFPHLVFLNKEYKQLDETMDFSLCNLA